MIWLEINLPDWDKFQFGCLDSHWVLHLGELMITDNMRLFRIVLIILSSAMCSFGETVSVVHLYVNFEFAKTYLYIKIHWDCVWLSDDNILN